MDLDLSTGSPEAAVMDLIDEVLACSTSRRSYIHGERHWQAVAVAGARLCEETPQANPRVVFLFALLHDALRLGDGEDPAHGVRAAALAQRLRRERAFRLIYKGEMAALVEACSEHDSGRTSRDPTIGVCWDADRLNLWRRGVEIEPDPKLLSTEAAKRPEMIEWAREECSVGGTPYLWDEVIELYSPEVFEVVGSRPPDREPEPLFDTQPRLAARYPGPGIGAMTAAERQQLAIKVAMNPYLVAAAASFFGKVLPPHGVTTEHAVEIVGNYLAVTKDRDRADKHDEGLADHLARAGFVDDSPYFRLGEPPPEGEASKTYWEDGAAEVHGHFFWAESKEAGVSVLPGKLTREGHYILQLTNRSQPVLWWLMEHERRPAYFVWGEERPGARGGDGEPLLKTVSKVRPIPKRCIVASTPHLSYTLQQWNERRGVGFFKEANQWT